MRYLSAAIAALSLLAVSPALAADDDAPSFDKGPVWDFGQVQTKDGHFDDYMKWLSTQWKAQQEALKKAGYIISYKVLVVADPRQGEPDIILATEYANMAAFDRSSSEEYATQKKIFGPLVVASQQQAARGSIRTILGDVIMREAILK
jgi:hypothetical protein